LVKPDGTDLVDIAVINSNYDKIDANIASTKIQATKPATANAGDLWWDSNTGTLYLYYTDANSSQWVAATSDPVNIGVVANQSERDAQYPTPGQGMSVYRTDLGYRENYYGLYNVSTNPGGKTPAGWYREAGQIAQIVWVQYGVNTSTTSSGYVTTGLTASITPTSANSRIIVSYSIANVRRSGATNGTVRVALFKNSTNVQESSIDGVYTTATTDLIGTSVSGNYVEIAGSTSPITYNPRFATNSVGTAIVQTNGAVSSMTIMEVTQ
jgi:hypothetical protein